MVESQPVNLAPTDDLRLRKRDMRGTHFSLVLY
jgi:hypothetical protein